MSSSSQTPALPVPVLPDIIQRYAKGETMEVLAAECAVNRSTIYRWMLGELGEGAYQQVVTDCLINRIADADEMLMNAQDSCNIARAREIARFTRMDFERRRPKLYGAQPQTQHNTAITVVIQRETPPQVVGQIGGIVDVSLSTGQDENAQ